MREQLSTTIDNAIMVILLLVAGLTPLLFFNKTTEFYDTPKLIFLVVATLILVGLWIFSWILKGKVVIARTPLDIPLLILLVAVIVSTYLSDTKFAAIYGDLPRVHGSAVSWVTYILLYFVTVSNLRGASHVRSFLYVLFGSGALVAFLTILSFFGIYLPFDFARAVNFTPTGSSFSTSAFLLLLLPLSLLSLVHPNKYLPTPFALAASILFGITIALIGTLPVYVLLFVTILLTLFVARPQQVRSQMGLFIVPIAVTLLTLAVAYMPFPGNSIQKLEANFPKEVQLPFGSSWKISASTFRDAPLFGTGPSTYLYNFTAYKPIEFNSLKFWNFSFDTAYNEFLQLLGTIGLIGFATLGLISLVVILNAWKNMTVGPSDSAVESSHVVLPALSVSAVISILLLVIHASTLVSFVVTLFIFAALMMSQRSIREKVMELSIGIKASTAGNRQFDLLPVIFFIVFLIAAGFVVFKGYTLVAADYYHRQALAQATKSATLTYSNLQKAEQLNPYSDLYRVDMAQTNFAIANAIAAQKGPSSTNPKGSLTDQDKKTIQTLLSQSINEGRASVTINPRSARNWEVLASIYRNIAGVAQNALTFSLDAYGRAIQRDPLNPALRVSVGGIYYSAKSYDLAIRFFSDAANLKPDYANAYYNLAIALRDKGDLQNARLVAQQTATLLGRDTKTIDYDIANNLLKDLDARIATNSALNTSTVGNVDVSNLENTPEVATPAAVKKNPNAKLPVETPTPTKAP